MLFDIETYISKKNRLSGKLRGVVVDNYDPLNYGRIKVHIDNVMEGEKEILPYIYPQFNAFLGSGEGNGMIAIPKIDSVVEIEFRNNDIYDGYYVGIVMGNGTVNPTFNAPDIYGFKDDLNNGFIINSVDGVMTISHASGSSIVFNPDGNLIINTTQGIVYQSNGENSVSIDNTNNSMSINFKELYEILSNEYYVEANTMKNNVAYMNTNITGKEDHKVAGNSVVSIGSNSVESVVGDKDVSILGKYNIKTVDKKTEIIGNGEERKILIGSSINEILAGDYILTLLAGLIDVSTKLGDISILTSKGNVIIETLVGDINITSKAGNVNIKGVLVNLADAKEPVLLGNKTVKLFSQHTHGTPVGASSTPLNASDAMNCLSQQVFTG